MKTEGGAPQQNAEDSPLREIGPEGTAQKATFLDIPKTDQDAKSDDKVEGG